MENNEVNKKLYESAFVSDGTFGDLNNWNPDIDERLIEESTEDERGKVKIFDRTYSLKKLQKIGQGKIEDDVLEWINQDVDYICDNSTVRFYVDYRWIFKNKKTGQQVDVYVRHYPDTDTISFMDGQDSVYYRKNEDE